MTRLRLTLATGIQRSADSVGQQCGVGDVEFGIGYPRWARRPQSVTHPLSGMKPPARWRPSASTPIGYVLTDPIGRQTRVIPAPLCCQPALLRDLSAVVFPAPLAGCSVGFAGPGSG